MRNSHHCTQCTGIHQQVPSKRQRMTLKAPSRSCTRCASRYPSHSNPALLFSTRRRRRAISLHSFYPLLRRWIAATIIPHALRWHPDTELTHWLQHRHPHTHTFSSARRHSFHPIRVSWKCAAIPNPFVTSVSADRGGGEKQWKWWFLSPRVGACHMQSALTFHLISFSI